MRVPLAPNCFCHGRHSTEPYACRRHHTALTACNDKTWKTCKKHIKILMSKKLFVCFLFLHEFFLEKDQDNGESVCSPCLFVSFSYFPKPFSTFGGEQAERAPYAHMHVDDCTCNVCEMRFKKSSACRLLMHIYTCHQWAYGRLPTGRATPLKQG